jgi:hypothetical protein
MNIWEHCPGGPTAIMDTSPSVFYHWQRCEIAGSNVLNRFSDHIGLVTWAVIFCGYLMGQLPILAQRPFLFF